jgi:hypothetical protein
MKTDSFVRDVKDFIEHCELSFESFIIWSFRTLSLRAHFKVAYHKIRDEAAEHVDYLTSTSKRFILPLSACYLCLGFLFGNNVIDSFLLSILVFVYSHFLPDLLSPFRIRNRKDRNKDGGWFKKHALLFFAPIFIFLLWGEKMPAFRTMEHFHNIKSLGAYGIFLFLLGLIFYGNMPLSFGRILEIFSLTIFGSIGYVSHLKVDKIL